MKITKSQLKQIIKEEIQQLSEMLPLAIRMGQRRQRRQQRHRDPGHGNLTIDDVKMVLQKLEMPQYAANLVWEKFNHLNGPEELEQALAQGFPNLEEAIEIGGETLSIPRPAVGAQEMAAFTKLKESMGLMEKAMLYMYSDGEEGQSPVEIAEMVRSILSENIAEKKGPPGKSCEEAHPVQEHEKWEKTLEEEKKTKVSKAGQKRVSRKIAHLIGDEGKSKEQAAAIAYSMEERGELK